MFATWGPAIHGHDHPKIREAIANALNMGTSFGTPGPAEVEMAELICEVVPSVEKVRMCNSYRSYHVRNPACLWFHWSG